MVHVALWFSYGRSTCLKVPQEFRRECPNWYRIAKDSHPYELLWKCLPLTPEGGGGGVSKPTRERSKRQSMCGFIYILFLLIQNVYTNILYVKFTSPLMQSTDDMHMAGV